MNATKSPTTRSPSLFGSERTKVLLSVLALFCLAKHCLGQGTMQVRFEGQPRGTYVTTSSYSESGMMFWNPYGPENLARIGSGLSGAPDNGTAFLDVTGGARLAFTFFSGAHFNLVSFDAAEETISYPGPITLQIVGYGSMGRTVTNYFTLDTIQDRRASQLPDFQTFYPDSRFANLYQVDIFTDRWSIDNVVISGVPEPSTGALILVGVLCAAGRSRMRNRRP